MTDEQFKELMRKLDELKKSIDAVSDTIWSSK